MKLGWLGIMIALQGGAEMAPSENAAERYNDCVSRVSWAYSQGNERRPKALAALACNHLLKPAVAVPFEQDDWRYFSVSAIGPSLAYPSKPPFKLVIGCKDTQISFHVRGLEPKQQWPQPELEIAVGLASRAKRPDLSYSGGNTGFATSFPIADSILNAIRAGEPIVVSFSDQRVKYPSAPEPMRKEFANKCAAFVPPGMRGE